MSERLEDAHLAHILEVGDASGSPACSMALEIQQHRAVMSRLKAWAEELRASKSVGPFVAQELEDRIAGRSGR